MIRFIIALAVPLALARPAAGEPSAVLTLDEAIAAARQRPTVVAATDEAEAADAAAVAERRRALLPTLSASGSISYRSRDLTVSIPMLGSLDVGERRALAAAAVIRQPILEPSILFYRAPSLRRAADAADHLARRSAGAAAGDAIDGFFDVLALDAQAASVVEFADSLETRLAEIGSLATEGRALERDVLRVRLALDDARQTERALAARRSVAVRALARAVGRTGVVEPRFDVAASPPRAPVIGDLVTRAWSRRGDLAALSAGADAARLERESVWAEIIPSLDVTGGWFFDDATLADQDQLFQITANLTWRPFVAGTRKPRARAAAARESANRRRLVDARRGVAIAIRNRLAEIGIAADALAVAERGVDEAAESRRVTAMRYRNGRETISDLIEAEALVADRDARARLARIELWRAHGRLRVEAGELDR